MTKDQENANLLMKDNALRNEVDSYPRKFVFLFEAKDLKELTKKSSIHRNLWWDDPFSESALLPFTTYIRVASS